MRRAVLRIVKFLMLPAILAASMASGIASAASVETTTTPIGDIKLQFGLPANAEEERRIYDEMDFQRATQGYIWAVPFVAMAEWKHAHLNEIGAVENETVPEFKDKLGILTANLTTPYLITFGNLSNGPVIVEMPVGNFGGMVMDFWQRPMMDLGQAGPMGELMSMNISFAKRFPNSYYRDDAKWAYVIMFDPSQEKPNYTELDERTDYFYEAVTAAGGMVSTTPGVGSAYLGAYKDKNNQWFDGSRTYRLHVPPNPPAKNFWSLTVYDTYNRVQLDNPSQVADISSRKEGLKINDDGSVDLYVGPQAPKGWEKNWIETVPDKAWFAYFRFYGPTEGYFNRTYALPDFEEVTN